MTEEMRTLCLSNEGLGLKLIPWVGAAAKLEQEPIEGRAFSSLPLPIKTGLPVHVNGSFEVIDGREKLWTMRDGLQGEASVKALWNQLLISDVVSLCYSAVLVKCADVDEERLLGLLGVPQLKTVDFYIEEIFPRLSSLMQTVPEAGEFVAHMLSNLDSLVSEGGERAFDALKNLPCINSPLGLLRLSELTHPDTVSNVAPEVNKEGFDAVFFAPDATLRSTVPTAQLERLGMDSRRGILAAARRVESGQASEAVWACLVLNHATLFGEQPVRVPAQRLHVAPMSSEDFVVELLGDLKLPVMAQGEPGVPWPAGVHGTPFAPCAAVQPYAKRFLVSASIALNESRDDYQAKQAVIASAEDAELAPAQSARDCSRDRLIKALEVAEDRKLSLVGTGSDRELEEMVRATEQRRHAMESAARSATEVAASIDPRLGSRPPLSHDAAAKLASADGESTALSTALIGSAVAMLDNYMSPPTVQQTEAAALRCSHAMSAVDLFAASTTPPAAAIVGELCALHAAIAAESAFWKSYSPVEAFPLHALLAASRAEVERLRQLEVHYTSVLGEASKLAAERSMHLEAARLSRTGGVQTLMAELQQFHAELVEGQDSLEDATTKLRRATRPLNASGDPVATAAALQAARDAVNSIEARLHHAHAQAHEQLHLFPELERRLARTVPLELAPIYREHRSLHQYQSIDGGIFDKATCVLHTEFQSNHVVYQALLDDRRVALKEYRTDARSLARCYKEALVLRRLHHPGIVEIEAIFAFESNLYLQMPFYARGTLRQWAQQQQPDHTALATVLQLVLEALAHLHAHRVFHLDLKPENILIDAAGRPHIADYDISHDGATRAVARRQTHMGVTRVGTDGFVAPELEAGAEASAAADLYSLGRTIEAVVPDEPLRRSAPLSALIEQLTRQDPAARPSAAHAAQHAYFAPLLAGRFEGLNLERPGLTLERPDREDAMDLG
ncbi:protein kinase [Chrysochromulina tobinii]|uniref:Protein kinase n=1 Tax=Chrysochromulina tobinii TaxID=1460289 RepID=A0A0M0J7P6_9EUKA|nr:protein kinase [Chrysochromulina tobinii]|eukprot:KOO22253.1 protein kinase [Chrysochromulina sp. CCMP291]